MHKRLLLLLIIGSGAHAETVDVKYRGSVDLKPFVCEEYMRSSFIRRICYDEANSHMLIRLNQTWYQYCAIGPDTVAGLKTATSMGRYFNQSIKGHFGCPK
jgi:hypothetical protein